MCKYLFVATALLCVELVISFAIVRTPTRGGSTFISGGARQQRRRQNSRMNRVVEGYSSRTMVALDTQADDSSSSANHQEVIFLSPWTTLNPESLVAAPCLLEQTLCQPSDDQPQLAKDKSYAQAVLDAWRTDEANSELVWDTEWCRIQYTSVDGTPLYGHLIQRPPKSDTQEQEEQQSPRPGVVFFHTGAGPHDLFLLYKAASLVNSFSKNNVLVMVADILSDETGWAWDPDRTKYNMVRDQLLYNNSRWLLQERVEAALETIEQLCLVSTTTTTTDRPKLACLGWCLGGQAILEVAKLQQNDLIRALVTFHGVFDGAANGSGMMMLNEEESLLFPKRLQNPTLVLLCHGTEDPFTSNGSLEQALSLLQTCQCRTSLLRLAKAKHGFTNPAQEFNDNPAFGYDSDAAQKAWKQAMNLLKRTLTDD